MAHSKPREYETYRQGHLATVVGGRGLGPDRGSPFSSEVLSFS